MSQDTDYLRNNLMQAAEDMDSDKDKALIYALEKIIEQQEVRGEMLSLALDRVINQLEVISDKLDQPRIVG